MFPLSYHNSLHADPEVMNITSPQKGTSQVSPHSIDVSVALLFSHTVLVKMLSQSSTGA